MRGLLHLAAGALLAAGPARAATPPAAAFELTGGTPAGFSIVGAGRSGGFVADGGTCGAGVALSGGGFSLQCGQPALGLLSHEVDNLIEAEAFPLKVVVPADALPSDFELFINGDPVKNPQRVDPSAIILANSRLATLGPAFAPQKLAELNAREENSPYYDKNFDRPSALTFSYSDSSGRGVVDGSDPPVRAKTLSVWTLDEARGVWQRVESSVDLSAKTVTASLHHFSVYALIGAADLDASNAFAFPVPWSPNSGNPSLGNFAEGIKFSLLPAQGAIKIFNLAGQLVRSLDIPLGAGQTAWDGKTSSGSRAASGVYLWRIEAGQNVKTGKLVIVL